MVLTLSNHRKHVFTQKLKFSLLEWETHGPTVFWKRATRRKEHTSTRLWETCWGLEPGSVNGGIVSVLEFAIGKQNYRKLDHFTTWMSGIFQKLWLFYPECQSQNKFSSILPVCMSNFIWLFSGPLCSPELFHKVESDVFILFFFSILRTDFRWNPCLRSWKNSSFLQFCLLGRGFEVLPKSGSLTSVPLSVSWLAWAAKYWTCQHMICSF